MLIVILCFSWESIFTVSASDHSNLNKNIPEDEDIIGILEEDISDKDNLALEDEYVRDSDQEYIPLENVLFPMKFTKNNEIEKILILSRKNKEVTWKLTWYIRKMTLKNASIKNSRNVLSVNISLKKSTYDNRSL